MLWEIGAISMYKKIKWWHILLGIGVWYLLGGWPFNSGGMASDGKQYSSFLITTPGPIGLGTPNG